MAGAHVTTVTSRTYRLPLPRPWGPEVTCQYLIATTVGSSDGGSGQGFSWAVRAGAQAIQAMVDADCRPVAEGGPVAPAAAWDRLWWHLREAGGGVTTLAMAAIDIGLWDLRARAAGLRQERERERGLAGWPATLRRGRLSRRSPPSPW